MPGMLRERDLKELLRSEHARAYNLQVVAPSIEGSKGVINGVISSNFVENVCDDGMIHCFESYSDDMTEITASCQTMNTDAKLISVCQVGCQSHADLNVTVCCCDDDLCNLPDSEKPTASPSSAHLPPRLRQKFGPFKLSKSL
ncbi:unnamed protein product [Heligmosomoides polygyrus]|uniref:Activin_recp domain-containing protein n=1 Tax=Heligmosomoides polygyrus TaxID=6339 RepID=A0A3P7XIP1_HELPZ|nr:unnamed protein product [Heligmosomoides polygyrus]